MSNDKEEIKAIQILLKDFNLYKGTIDGIFGKNTKKAVEMFQKYYDPNKVQRHHEYTVPLVVDGVVGRNTILAMDEADVNDWRYGDKCYCNRDFTVDEVKNIVDKLRLVNGVVFTALWTPKYSSSSSPEDKSYETTTKELNRILNKYNINTCIRKIHFLAQTYHETDGFRAMTEYTSIYTSKYDPYRGRGLIHLTHESNYKKFSQYMNDSNIVNNPSVVATNISYAFEVAGWFWKQGKILNTSSTWDTPSSSPEYVKKYNATYPKEIYTLNSIPYGAVNLSLIADNDQIDLISWFVNGGSFGLEERRKYCNKLKEVFDYENCSNKK